MKRFILLSILLVGMNIIGLSQTQIGVTQQDLTELASFYKADTLPVQIATWKELMNNSDRIRDDQDVPSDIKDKIIVNSQLTSLLNSKIESILKIYGKKYQIAVVRGRTPFVMVEDDRLLVFSTELLRKMRADSELQGTVGHEIAHSIFTNKAETFKRYLANEETREQAKKALSIVELSCDAISMRTMQFLKIDSTSFLALNLLLEKNYPVQRSKLSFHPSAELRLQFGQMLTGEVSNVVPAKDFDLIKSILSLEDPI